jgi:predicted nucleotidyltransferase
MLTQQTILSRLRENKPHLASEFGVSRLGLFGSFAQETTDDNSDVDLIVELSRPIGLRFMDLVEHLESLLGRKVDVLTLAGLRNIRVQQVARRIEESVLNV